MGAGNRKQHRRKMIVMVDAIVLLDRIMTSFALGESHFREFKSALEGPPGSKTPRDKKAISRDICETSLADISDFAEQPSYCLPKIPRGGTQDSK